MNELKRNVIGIFIAAIVAGFSIEVFSPELQKAGLPERFVNALAAGITGTGLIFLAINVPKMKNRDDNRADWGPVHHTYVGIKEIEPGWVSEHLSQVHVLDVRSEDEFENDMGHIATAQLIPLGELESRLNEIPTDLPLVTVCHSGGRSSRATVMLQHHGIDRTASIRGGMLAWKAAGLPTASQ